MIAHEKRDMKKCEPRAPWNRKTVGPKLNQTEFDSPIKPYLNQDDQIPDDINHFDDDSPLRNTRQSK